MVDVLAWTDVVGRAELMVSRQTRENFRRISVGSFVHNVGASLLRQGK